MNKLISCISIIMVFICCKESTENIKVKADGYICNSKVLNEWAEKLIKTKSESSNQSEKVSFKLNNENSVIEIIWLYSYLNATKIKDNNQVLVSDLITEKINDFEGNISFEYVIYGYCPKDSSIPIEENSEIRNLVVRDSIGRIKYQFNITRGRISSMTDYKFSKDNIIAQDSTQINF